jgi:hypothetical protein
VTDPFIDDSELALDNRTYFAQTKQAGFYVSSGEVALARDKSVLNLSVFCLIVQLLRSLSSDPHQRSLNQPGRHFLVLSVLNNLSRYLLNMTVMGASHPLYPFRMRRAKIFLFHI